MPKSDRMSGVEALVRAREGIRPKKPDKWRRIDRELDRIEAEIDDLLARHAPNASRTNASTSRKATGR